MVFSSTFDRKNRSSVDISGPKASGSRAPKHMTPSGEPDETLQAHQHVGLHEARDVAEEGLFAHDVGAQAGMLVGADGGVDGARRQHVDAAHRHALGRVGVGLDRHA